MDNLRRMLFVTSASDIPGDFKSGDQYNGEIIEALYVYYDSLALANFKYQPCNANGTTVANLYAQTFLRATPLSDCYICDHNLLTGSKSVYTDIHVDSGYIHIATIYKSSNYYVYQLLQTLSQNNKISIGIEYYAYADPGPYYIYFPINSIFSDGYYIKAYNQGLYPFPTEWYYKPYSA